MFLKHEADLQSMPQKNINDFYYEAGVNTYYKIFYNVIKFEDDKNLTKSALAKACNISNSLVSRVYNHLSTNYGLLGTEENLNLKGTSKHYLIFKPKEAINFLVLNKTKSRNLSKKYSQDWDVWTKNTKFDSNSIDLFPSDLSLGLYSDILDGQPTLFITLILSIYLQKKKGIFTKNRDLKSNYKTFPSFVPLLVSISFSGAFYTTRKFLDFTFTDKVKLFFQEKKITSDLTNFFTKLENLNQDLILRREKNFDGVIRDITFISDQYGLSNQLNYMPNINSINFMNMINKINEFREKSDQMEENSILIKLPEYINKNDIDDNVPMELTIQMKDKTKKKIIVNS